MSGSGSNFSVTPGARMVAELLGRSGLSQSELARRAGIPRSVLNVYLHGRREPGADALIRLAAAAGFDLAPTRRVAPVDAERAGRILVQVLELAEALPFRPRAQMDFPPLAQRLAEAS
jgi:transcriptional regulator with XRE-family HTH domain